MLWGKHYKITTTQWVEDNSTLWVYADLSKLNKQEHYDLVDRLEKDETIIEFRVSQGGYRALSVKFHCPRGEVGYCLRTITAILDATYTNLELE